jgi:outer membrane protein assembly factor BamD
MSKRFVLRWAILLTIAISFLFGCAGKGKDVKTIKGDPEVLYRQGLERFNKRDYPEALKIFEQIKSSFPDSPPYTVWAELKVGDCHFFKKDYVEAIAAYEEFRKTRPTHEDIPYVQYQIGMAYSNQMSTPDRDQTPTKKALSTFEYLVANYPPSIFTEKAAKKIEACKKQLADHEFYIGNFYYKRGKYQAAVFRLEGLLEKFPKRTEEDKTLYLLGKSYLEIDQWEKARDAFTRIVAEYPKSSHYREAKSILDQGKREKAVIRKAKAKEPRRKTDATERESEMIALVKFDEERRRPVPLIDKKVEMESPLQPTASPIAPRITVVEETPKISPPLIKYEEEKRQPVVPPSLPFKEELKIEVRPEDEKRMAAIPPSPEPTEIRTIPKKKEGREKAATKEETPADSKGVQLGDTGEPIDITSDRVEAFSKENLIIFRGNVMARQKDIVIYSDSLEAMIFEGGKGIEKVVAGGNVKIQQGLRVASCQKAVFYNRDQRVVMTGDPKVWEGGNMVSGEEIIFDIEKNRIEVRGGPGGRGKVRVLPGGEFEKPK